jgi:DNA-binding NtrC family response regulator
VSSILIVDDDDQLRFSFQKLLALEGYEVRVAASGEAGLEAVKSRLPDLVVMDVRMPGMSGLETFRAMREVDSKLPVVIMTAYGTTETAIEATKLGAFDYVLKPFEVPEVLSVIDQAIDAGRFMRSRVTMDGAPGHAPADALIGKSEAMQEIYKAIGRVAPTDATVLIRGESGTGKELVARAVYQHGLRSDKPFLVINCVAIPETLLESELFGYERGAFTGAQNRKIGKIEQASGGTVFLDEIGDMPLSIQAKILRLLQERSIERLGGREPIPVDVRIIAATNRNLRERKSDAFLLTEYFLARFAREMDIDNPGVNPEVQAVLAGHLWPGNVRELANTVQKALIFSRGCPIRPDDINQAIHEQHGRSETDDDTAEEAIAMWVRRQLTSEEGGNIFGNVMDHFASILISEALNLTGGNRTRASKLLGLSRPTLQAKIEKFQLKIKTSVDTD